MRFVTSLVPALIAISAIGAPAFAQDAPPPAPVKSRLCEIHGDGCDAPPAEWSWQRQEPQSASFSVEIPCDDRQADEFGLMFTSRDPRFLAEDTRACAKIASAFSAGLIGSAALPDGETRAEIEEAFGDAPDMFTAIVQQITDSSIPMTMFKGRRAVVNVIERPNRRSKIALVEVGRFGVIILSADILAGFPGTPEEGVAAADRFLESLEIAE